MRYLKIIFTSIVLISPLATAQAKLPDLGDPDSTTLTLTQETALGQALWQRLNASTLLDEDIVITQYLQSIGNKLTGTEPAAPMGFTFFSIANSNINAFALPGGYIGIHEGLVVATESEDELASVLAHEIAHVRGRHIARMLHFSNNVSMTSIAGMLAGALVSAANPVIGSSIFTSAMAGGQQSLINFTRQQEKEADNVGMQIMHTAGYNPRAMAKFFDTLMKHTRQQENPAVEYLRTHPLTETRMTRAQERAQHLDTNHAFLRPESYLIIQARITNKNFASPRLAIRHFQKRYQADADDISARYGLALAYLNNGKAEQAISLLDGLPYDKTPFAELLLAQAYWDSGHPDKAIARLKNLAQHWPRDIATQVSLAQLQLAQSHPQQAVDTLSPLAQHYPYNPQILRTLSEAFAAQEKYFQAHIAQADYQYSKGFLTEALIQLDQAQRWAGNAPDALNTLEQKQAQIKRALQQQKQLGLLN